MSRSAQGTCAIVATVLFCAVAFARAATAPLLSDRGAVGLIESWFVGSGWTENLRIGTLVVVRETPACAGGVLGNARISESEYGVILAWARAGLVKLSVTKIADGQPPLAQTVSTECAPLAIKRIEVAPTSAGLALDKSTPVTGTRDARFLYAKTYTAQVTKIVDNSELLQSSDVYRVVKCIVRFHYTKVGRELARLKLGHVLESQKQIVLLKYDPFDRQWRLVTSDAAAFDSDFKTQKVADFLLQHGSL